MKRLIALLLLLTGLQTAIAVQQLTVCAKQGNWRPYLVSASLYTGSELNKATRTFDYTAFSRYVVIFWSQEQATVIELSKPSLSAIGTSGTDQQGREWHVSTSSNCF